MKKKIISKQVNKESTTLVRINSELKDLLKTKAATEKTSIKALVEGAIADVLAVE